MIWPSSLSSISSFKNISSYIAAPRLLSITVTAITNLDLCLRSRTWFCLSGPRPKPSTPSAQMAATLVALSGTRFLDNEARCLRSQVRLLIRGFGFGFDDYQLSQYRQYSWLFALYHWYTRVGYARDRHFEASFKWMRRCIFHADEFLSHLHDCHQEVRSSEMKSKRFWA